MNLEQTVFALLSKNEQLGQENDHLKSMLSVVQENIDLRARMQSFNHDPQEGSTGIVNVFSLSLDGSQGAVQSCPCSG